MKNIETNEVREEILKQMDRIVGVICTNIINQKNINQKIELINFREEDYGHLLYYECAKMVSLGAEDIFLDMPFKKYIKFKIHNFKDRKLIKRIKETEEKDTIDQILNFVCKSYKIQYLFLKNIYEEYYKKEKK